MDEDNNLMFRHFPTESNVLFKIVLQSHIIGHQKGHLSSYYFFEAIVWVHFDDIKHFLCKYSNLITYSAANGPSEHIFRTH